MSPVVAAGGRLGVPVALTIAVALLVNGYTGTGDGFVGGALAAIALGLQIVAGGPAEAERQPLIRHAGAVVLAGLALALLIAVAPVLGGSPPLTHMPAAGESVRTFGSIELTTALAFDAAIFLVVLGAFGGILGRLARDIEEARS